MRILLVVLLLFLSSTPLFASEVVEVHIDVSTKDKPDAAVREEGRLKAIDKAIERLPQLIEGREFLNDGVFIEQIKAVSYAVVDFTALSERWDRDERIYHLVASVSLDTERSFGLLSKLSENEAKIKALMDAYDSFQSSLNQTMIGYDFLSAFSDYQALNLASIATPDIKTLLKANADRKKVFIEKYNELMRYIASSMQIALTEVNVNTMMASYAVSGLNPYKEIRKLVAYLGDTTVENGKLAKVCGFSDSGFHYIYNPNPFIRKNRENETITSQTSDVIKLDFQYEHFNQQAKLDAVENTFVVKACF